MPLFLSPLDGKGNTPNAEGKRGSDALLMGGGVPDLGVATLLLLIGDSNAAGNASDQGSLVYTPDASVFALNSSGNFAQYVPGTFTGRSSGADAGNVGPEMQFSRLHRAADSTKPVFICKNAYPGSLQTGQWDPATGAYVAETLAMLANAKAKMAALGYTPKVVAVVNLGINDTGLAQASKYTYGTVARSMYVALKAVLAPGEIIIQNRVTEDSTGAFAVRCMQQAKTKNDPVLRLSNTDGFTKNSGDVTHYDLAGQISLGTGAYNIFKGTDLGLRLDFYSDNFSAIGPTVTWSLNPGWSITGGKMVGASVPAFGATGILLPFEPGKSYRNSYGMTFVAGAVRVQMLGGTTVTGATRTTTNTFTETLVALTGNTQFAWNATGGGFSGDMDNLLIEEL